MNIEVLPITQLKPYENNAKIHTPVQIAQIAASIQEFGNNDPIAVDENNMVLEGHGRLLALKSLGYTEVEVIRLVGLTEDQKRAYILVHNKLTMNTGFDFNVLDAELARINDIDMSVFDFGSIFWSANRLQYMTNSDKLLVSQGLFDRGILSTNGVMDIWHLPHVEDGDKRYIRKEYTEVSQLDQVNDLQNQLTAAQNKLNAAKTPEPEKKEDQNDPE